MGKFSMMELTEMGFMLIVWVWRADVGTFLCEELDSSDDTLLKVEEEREDINHDESNL